MCPILSVTKPDELSSTVCILFCFHLEFFGRHVCGLFVLVDDDDVTGASVVADSPRVLQRLKMDKFWLIFPESSE